MSSVSLRTRSMRVSRTNQPPPAPPPRRPPAAATRPPPLAGCACEKSRLIGRAASYEFWKGAPSRTAPYARRYAAMVGASRTTRSVSSFRSAPSSGLKEPLTTTSVGTLATGDASQEKYRIFMCMRPAV